MKPPLITLPALLVFLTVVAGCGDDDTTVDPGPIDSSSPDAVANLRAAIVTAETVELRWTATGDNGANGIADAYDVRYATAALSDANWASAATVATPPAPQAAGGNESFRVSGLVPVTTYYFGIKARDEAGNESPISNVAVAATHGAMDYYVDARNGNDLATGSLDDPLKTITQALSLATDGDSIRVLPGLYDAANGEAFPLMVPAGVSVFGDEANKGSGEDSTMVVGGGLVGGTNQSAAFRPESNTLIAGFRVTNAVETPEAPFPHGIMVGIVGPPTANNVTIRNNTLTRNGAAGAMLLASSGHSVTGNVSVDNNRSGLWFQVGDATNSVVENNVLTGNVYGIELSFLTTAPDCGGGASGSVGANVVSCNILDVMVFESPGLAVSAANNLWDHVPPTEGTANNFDVAIIGSDGAVVNAAGAKLAQPGCP
jgi:hypothetical protein